MVAYGIDKDTICKKEYMTYLICGPPGAGKTTYALKHMSPGDVIIDFDMLHTAISGQPLHHNEASLNTLISDLRETLIANIDVYTEIRNTWVTLCAPKKSTRDFWRGHFDAKVILLKERISTCLARLAKDPTRHDWEKWRPDVERWWREFRE